MSTTVLEFRIGYRFYENYPMHFTDVTESLVQFQADLLDVIAAEPIEMKIQTRKMVYGDWE